MSDIDDKSLLFARSGLPADLVALAEKYPRQTWRSDRTLGEMGRFWLKRHDMFRELGGALDARATDLQEGRDEPDAFARWFARRLNFFLGELNGHHMVEDQHYFPAFATAEPALQRGFDILETDHDTIHHLLESNAAAANAFIGALPTGGDALKYATDAYAADIGRLIPGLLRHLEDEEDIIIPLLIDRGEGHFGVS